MLPQDTTNGPKGLAANLKKSYSELEKLREENRELKVLLQNTNSLLHTISKQRPRESKIGSPQTINNTPSAVSTNKKGNSKNKNNRPKQTASRKQITKPKSNKNGADIIILTTPTNAVDEI